MDHWYIRGFPLPTNNGQHVRRTVADLGVTELLRRFTRPFTIRLTHPNRVHGIGHTTFRVGEWHVNVTLHPYGEHRPLRVFQLAFATAQQIGRRRAHPHRHITNQSVTRRWTVIVHRPRQHIRRRLNGIVFRRQGTSHGITNNIIGVRQLPLNRQHVNLGLSGRPYRQL